MVGAAYHRIQIVHLLVQKLYLANEISAFLNWMEYKDLGPLSPSSKSTFDAQNKLNLWMDVINSVTTALYIIHKHWLFY